MDPIAIRRNPCDTNARRTCSGRAPERHAHRDLAAPLRHRVAEHTVGADRRQEQRQRGEQRRQHRRRSARDETVGDTRVHRSHVAHRESRIDGRTA